MEVQLTDDQRALIQRAIESGRYRDESDVLREALSLWEERERRRAEILAAVDQAEASFTRGEGRKITSAGQARQLADEIKDRGRARLAGQLPEAAERAGRGPGELAQDVIAGYLRELAEVRDRLDARYDDLKNGKVQPVDGEAFFEDLRLREEALLRRLQR